MSKSAFTAAITLSRSLSASERQRQVDDHVVVEGGTFWQNMLRALPDLEYADIASVMGIPAVTARTLVHRGLKKLATRLGGEER